MKDAVFPEANSASRRMKIIPDRWTLDSRNFNRRFEGIVSRIMTICSEISPEKAYVIAPTVVKAARIRERLSELMSNKADLPEVDYYRSDHTIGVERSERVCIAIGMAQVPSNACDHLATGKDSEERAISSAKIRNQSVQAATWQAWNRVKDPTGENVSLIFCIGIKARHAADCATWGTNRKLELIKTEETTYGESPETAKKARNYRFKVTVDHSLDMPRIQVVPRADRRAGRARPDLMIMDILSPDEVLNVKIDTPDNENILKACGDKFELCYMLTRYIENLANALYINNRVFARKTGYHVNTYHGITSGHEEDKEKVAAFLALYFCHRTDCHAVQIFSKQHQKWEFIKTDGDLNDYTLELVKKHLRADVSGIDRRFTMGVYQIAPDTDTVSWICYDLDRHKLEDPDPKEAVQRLLSVLSRYRIPYLLESSGSPDSYHVWLFLVPTKTSNAYCFSKEIAKAANVNCEIFPKQPTHSGGSGNLVKLPLAYHNKTGNRSCFIDPETFEPLEYVSFPGLVRLFEQPIVDSGMNAKQRSKVQFSAAPNTINSDFRLCLKAVLDSGNCLEGSEGNDMRVAIGIEAKCAGIPIEEATKMFSHLLDFNEEITRSHLEYIYSRQYNRLRCDRILEKSGSIIAPYCMKCARPWASENLAKCGRATA